MADKHNSAETRFQPFDSRALASSAPQLSSQQHLEFGEIVSERSVGGSFRQLMDEHRAESPTSTRAEVLDQIKFKGDYMLPLDEWTSKISLKTSRIKAQKSAEDTDLTLWSQSEEYGMECKEPGCKNDAKTVSTDLVIRPPKELWDEIHSSPTDAYSNSFHEQKTSKHEESYVGPFDYKPESGGQKNVSLFQKIDNIGGYDTHPQYARTLTQNGTEVLYPEIGKEEDSDEESLWTVGLPSEQKLHSDSNPLEEKYFSYDPPLFGETGSWIPVSVPPMSESEHEEWSRGFGMNGGYLPDGDLGWSQMMGEEKELTMWDVVLEILLVARGKVGALTSGDFDTVSWISGHLMEQAWKEMTETLTEANNGNTQEILDAEPPKWLPDSAASACMLCSVRFHPIMCTRHHCRYCGGLFCGECSKGRSLLPEKYRVTDPQRVCDVCCVRLHSVQPYLMDHVSRAAQLPTHDLTDLSTLRSWVNFPWGQSMEYEIYKATNTVRGYTKIGSLAHEKRIPEAILRHAKGLAILTVVRVGMMVTYNIGTGLVVARREDGSWSPPSAISSFGVGWGAQAGGELTDFIIVLRNSDAVKTFCNDTHLSVGAGMSAALGAIGRTAEADLRAGVTSYASCYTYSCSKGAFVGCSLEGSVVASRKKENHRFYGSQTLTACDILLGSMPRPPAAAILYRALADLYQKF